MLFFTPWDQRANGHISSWSHLKRLLRCHVTPQLHIIQSGTRMVKLSANQRALVCINKGQTQLTFSVFNRSTLLT